MTHGSLFSGIGGFDLGFQWANIKTLWDVEIDEYCQKVLELRFPNSKKFKDIKDVGKNNLQQVDIISGGFPCQDISIAGKGAGIEGARSGLWSEMFRVIRELRPRFAVIENVPMLIHRGLGRVLSDLTSIGYDVEWTIISARDIGFQHFRKRIWIVAYPYENRMDKTKIFKKFNTESNRKTEIKQSLIQYEYYGSRNIKLRETDKDRICREDDGLPFWMDRLKSLGNSIIPQIAYLIGRRLMKIQQELFA